MNVIVLAENHYNALGLVRSLGEAGHHVYVILKSSKNNFLVKSKHIKSTIYFNDASQLFDLIVHTCKKFSEKPILFSSTEEYAELIDKRYDELQKYCYTEGGEHANTIQPYRNKTIANELAKSVGFTLPKTWSIKCQSDIEQDFIFPVLVKSEASVPGWKSAMKRCDDYTALVNHVSSLPLTFFPLQVQEFIDKDYEFMLLGCSSNHGERIYSYVGHKKYRYYPNIYSLGCYSESFLITEKEQRVRLLEKATKFVKSIGYSGLFSAEFIHANGKDYFLEINLRNDATSIVSTRSGYNLPAIFCNAIEGKRIDETTFKYVPRHYMNIVPDIHHVLNHSVSVFTWLRQLYSAGAYAYFDKKDIKPFIYYLWGHIRPHFKAKK